MKSIKDIARIVKFSIVSTPDKGLWTHPLLDIDIVSTPDKDIWTHPLNDINEARTDDTHYIAAFMVGEEKEKPVKETFETLIGEASVSWNRLCELFAALYFYFDAALLDGDVSACIEYLKCIKEVTSVLNDRFGEDKASWSRFVNYMRSAEKAKNK